MTRQAGWASGRPVARAALRSVLTSGWVAPSGGETVLAAIASRCGCGLLDRLIALQCSAEEPNTPRLVDAQRGAHPRVLRQCSTTAITAVRALSALFDMGAMPGRSVSQLKMPRPDAQDEAAHRGAALMQ